MRRFEARNPLSAANNIPERPETRARKRLRLSEINGTPSPQSHQTAYNGRRNPSQLKRSRSRMLSSSTQFQEVRKRRRSTNPSATPSPCPKRPRTADPPDVEMADISNEPRIPPPRRRKKLLRDILRAEKISRTTLQGLRVERQAPSSASATPLGMRNATRSARSENTPRREPSLHSITELTGDEEVCEVIDASENTDPNIEGTYTHSTSTSETTTPSVQAVLLENGLCAVHIVRADGSIQSVLIQPPGTDEAW